MNKKLALFSKYSMFIFVFIIAIVAIIFLVVTLQKRDFIKVKESFTPGLRQIYRPHMRRLRLHTTKIYNRMMNRVNTFLARMKII